MLVYKYQYVCSPYLMNDDNRQAAVNFCKDQLGKSYFYDIDNTPIDLDTNQSDWYCSELIVAAYYNATGSLMQIGVTEDGHVWPAHLYNTWQTSTILEYNAQFLQLSIDTSGPKWTIKVRNPNGVGVYVQYNTKMCFGGDAENWTGLNDTDSFTLSGKTETSKRVYTNFWATHVTFSWVYSNSACSVRYVTYADGLNANGSINVKYNMVRIID